MNIKDKILNELYTAKVGIGDGQLANLFDVTRAEIMQAVGKINLYKADLILTKPDRWGENDTALYYNNTLIHEYEAIVSGGGFDAIERSQDEEKEADFQRQTRRDRAEIVDLKNKEWQYKVRYYPYIISTIALLVSLGSLFMAVRVQLSATQSKQSVIKSTESKPAKMPLNQADTLLKKRN